ncbi:unnamed protein product [Blepharisma stoltei]|uniref:RING-type E3 ubiquitin transferase n=1 Tax=Blepharisma stoltei TaxID=1481888 RepID=A0AAU9I8N5_9CILI|nr:unnamed protein product [Blepharisma stoltei]
MDRDIEEQHYYCHACKVTSSIDPSQLLCPRCGSDFLQVAEIGGLQGNFQADPNPFIFEIHRSNEEDADVGNHRENGRLVINPSTLFGRLAHDLPEGQSEMERRDITRRALIHVLMELMEDGLGQRNEVSQGFIENLPVVSIENELIGKECMICMEFFEKGKEANRLQCGHLFHSECLVPWLRMKNSCPTCKRRI